jgi:hypothetical protein
MKFHELKPLLELVSISEADQHQLFVLVRPSFLSLSLSLTPPPPPPQVDSDKSGQIDFSEFIQLVYHMGARYKEIRSHSLVRGRNKNHNSEKKIQQQEPRRLSRAGEEYFAVLAEDRLRLQREGSQSGNEEPHERAAGGFSDLRVRSDEGKSELEQAEDGDAPVVDMDSSGRSSESGGDPSLGVVAPL